MPGTLHKVKYIFHSCHFTVSSISYNKTFMIAETAIFFQLLIRITEKHTDKFNIFHTVEQSTMLQMQTFTNPLMRNCNTEGGYTDGG